MLNPMCCISPRIGVFIFAIIDLIFSIPLAYDSIRALLSNAFSWNRLLDCILCLTLLILACLLLFGAIQRNKENIRLWLGAWSIFVAVWAVLYIYQLITTSATIYWVTGYGLGMIVVFLYEIWVVYAYLIELRQGTLGIKYWPFQMTPTLAA